MTEPTVQVPVTLIERAPHAPGCQVAGLWILPENGGRAVQQSGKCTCWKAEVDALLSQPTPSAEPPPIADMAPGTTFTAEFTASGFNGERTRWLRDEHGLVLASTGLRISAFSIDPSTIRDVTVPGVGR